MGFIMGCLSRRGWRTGAERIGGPVVEQPEVAHGQDQAGELGQRVGLDQVAVGAGVVGPGNVIGPVGGGKNDHRHSPEEPSD